MSSGNYRKEKDCLNCGHHVEEHYCTHCGQPNIELKEPFWAFIGHSIGHYFHFDSKFLHTLIPLMTKPGQLTLDYLAGKRARYIHPVSLYIFVSIVYFLIVPHSLEEHKSPSAGDSTAVKTIPVLKTDTTQHAAFGNAVEIAAKKKVNRLLKEAYDKDAFDKLSRSAQQVYLDSIKKVYTAHPSDSLDNVIDGLKEVVKDGRNSNYADYRAYQKTLPAAKRDNWFIKSSKRASFYFKAKEAKEGKLNIDEEVKKYEPKQYFLLMPLLAFFIMLNFRKNKIYYIDHLVFTVHGMTAFFIVSIVAQPLKKYVFGLDSFASSMISLTVLVGVFWYLYTGLKLFYNRSTRLTVRKTITVVILYSFALFLSREVIEAIIIYLIK